MNLVKKVTKKLGQYVDDKENDIYDENGILNAKRIVENEEKAEKIPDRGFHFPKAGIFFLVIGAASEIVDAILLLGVLNTINVTNEEWQNFIISFIIGGTCFASMAYVGYQRGNKKIHNKKGEMFGYFTWAAAGVALCATRIYVGGLDKIMAGAELSDYETNIFRSFLVMAILQFVLYIGTGFLTRDAAEIVSNSDIWEYKSIEREQRQLVDELYRRRSWIKEGVSKLQIYPSYAERLILSKESVKKDISQYNESARAIIEARMASSVEPDLMTDMYDKATKKEGRAR